MNNTQALMTLTKHQKDRLKSLFKSQDRYQKLVELMEYAVNNGALTFKASKRSIDNLEINDSQLFRLIQRWAKDELEVVEAKLEAL